MAGPILPANIAKFVISSNKGGGAKDLSGAISEFKYYESVLSNNLTASAVIVDSGYDTSGPTKSVLDELPIRGGERTDIIVEDNIGNKLQFTTDGLYVNRVKNGDPGTSKEVYFLDFASKEFFANEQQRVIERYEGRISDHVEKIIRSINGKIEKIDPTSSTYNFIGNDRKPFYTCTWLASKAVPDENIGSRAGYLFYQTRDGFNFRSIDSLFEQEPTKKYVFNNTGFTPEGFDANILEVALDEDIDLKQNMTLGTYHNRSIYFDFFSMNYFVTEYKYREKELGKSGKYFGGEQVAKEFTESPTRLMSHVFDVGTMPNGVGNSQLENWKQSPKSPNFDAENALVQPLMRYNQMFSIKIVVTLDADFSIKAGDLIYCEFAHVEGKKQIDPNKQTGGIYMVASVCHRVTPRDTFTKLSLVRDSFGKKTGF